MIKFNPSVLNGKIMAPASKACGLRMLFAAAMASKSTKIENLPDCTDLRTAVDCLTALGCKINLKGDDRLTAVVEPFSKTASLKPIDFNFKESATTARFLTVIASAYGMPANCQAEGTLLKRSQVSMTSRMAVRGASFSSFSYPLTLEGRLSGGRFELPGDEGSQFICALLTALPVLRENSEIIITSPIADYTFIDITIDVLEKFGIHIRKTSDGFYIPGQQVFETPKKLVCENDWGIGTMWAAAGCVCAKNGGKITVNGLPEDSHQKYRDASGLFPLISQDFDDFNVDASSFPNLATVLAAFAIARGKTIRISGVPQLRHKETDRLRSICASMEQYGVTYQLADDGIVVSGKPGGVYPEAMPIDTCGDPWIYMALAIASTAFRSSIVLTDSTGAEKIYKNFLKDFKSVGGHFEIIGK